MPTSISIIGATGAVGSTLAGQILRSRLLEPLARLQLVAHGAGTSADKLLGLRIDLMDAFDDKGVDIEVVADLEDIDSDIVVMCAGVSTHAGLIVREEWGKANVPLFEQTAETCARRVPNSLFIIVSNPIELAVKIFADKLGRERVIGMGAEQDSLRFARAIAHDLGISRQQVCASVLGEHGKWMVPLWSSVKLVEPSPRLLADLDQMKKESTLAPLQQRVADLRSKVQALIETDEISEAYEVTRQALPDARISIQPLITWRTMNSTPNATTNATLNFLMAVLSGNQSPLQGQVRLAGEFLDIHGVCGIPIEIGLQGWKAGKEHDLAIEEQGMLRQAAAAIEEFLASVLAG